MNKLLNQAVPFILVTLAAGQPLPDRLNGRWRSTAVSPAGASAIFEFHGNALVDSYSALLAEGKYRLLGTDTILLQSGNREEKQELEWDNQDRARIEDEAAGKSIELVRIGKLVDSRNSLTGEWSTSREWNGRKYPARASFFPDGRAMWITILREEHGRYSANGGNIRLEISGRPVVEGKFAVTELRLTLPNPKGGEASFERF
jgi:hypothetical protein